MPDWGQPLPTEPTYGDYSQAFQSGAYGLLESLVGEARQYGHPDLGAELAPTQRTLRGRREAQLEDMTPAGRQQFTSEIGSPEFWRSPIGWTVAQSIGVAPYMAASIIPVIATGGMGGLAMAAATSGVLSDADLTSSVQEEVDNKTHEELSELSPQYADDILDGMSETDARNRLIQTMAGPGAHLAAIALGAGSAALGVPRVVGGAISRVTGRVASAIPQATGGALKGAAKEGTVSAISEYGEEAGVNLLTQSAEVEAGFRPGIDIAEANRAGLTGAIIGGPIGAVAGGVERFGKGEKRTAHTATPSTAPPPAPIAQATTTPPVTPIGGATPPPQPRGAGNFGRPDVSIPPYGPPPAPRPPPTAPPGGTPGPFGPAPEAPRTPQAPSGFGRPNVGVREPLPSDAVRAPSVVEKSDFGRPNVGIPVRPTGAQAVDPTTGAALNNPPRQPFSRTSEPFARRAAIPETGKTVLAAPLTPSSDVALALQGKQPEQPELISNQPPPGQPRSQQQIDINNQMGTGIAPPPRPLPAGSPPPVPPTGMQRSRGAQAYTGAAPPLVEPEREVRSTDVQGPPTRPPSKILPAGRDPLNLPAEENRALSRAYEETTKGPVVGGKVRPQLPPGVIREIPSILQSPETHAKYMAEVDALREEREAIEEVRAAKEKATVEGRKYLAPGPRVSKGKIAKSLKEKKEVRDPAEAKKLFEEFTDENNIRDGVLETRKRVERIIEEAKERNITITRADAFTPDHMVWLAEVRSLNRAFKAGRGTMGHVQEFLVREWEAVHNGNFDPMREARRIEGEMAKAGGGAQGTETADTVADIEAATAQAAEATEQAGFEATGEVEETAERFEAGQVAEEAAERGEEIGYAAREEGAEPSQGGAQFGGAPKPARGSETTKKSAPSLFKKYEQEYETPKRTEKVWNEFTGAYEERVVLAGRPVAKGRARSIAFGKATKGRRGWRDLPEKEYAKAKRVLEAARTRRGKVTLKKPLEPEIEGKLGELTIVRGRPTPAEHGEGKPITADEWIDKFDSAITKRLGANVGDTITDGSKRYEVVSIDTKPKDLRTPEQIKTHQDPIFDPNFVSTITVKRIGAGLLRKAREPKSWTLADFMHAWKQGKKVPTEPAPPTKVPLGGVTIGKGGVFVEPSPPAIKGYKTPIGPPTGEQARKAEFQREFTKELEAETKERMQPPSRGITRFGLDEDNKVQVEARSGRINRATTIELPSHLAEKKWRDIPRKLRQSIAKRYTRPRGGALVEPRPGDSVAELGAEAFANKQPRSANPFTARMGKTSIDTVDLINHLFSDEGDVRIDPAEYQKELFTYVGAKQYNQARERWFAGYDAAAKAAALRKPGLKGLPAIAVRRGTRDFEKGLRRNQNPYALNVPSLGRYLTLDDLREGGFSGSGAELSALLRGRQELQTKRQEVIDQAAIMEEAWYEGYDRAAEKTPRVDLKSTEYHEVLPPKIAPKAAAIKQRTVEQRRITARTQIDKKATDAQRAAGNARGGPLSFHGLEVMLQYAKGMTRHGLRLVADYGHIKSTIGADKQPVDIYLGPNLKSDTIYVIDQLDPATGAFDEHKVMAGFNSIEDARFALFSQVGDASIGDITPMTVPEFQKWIWKDHSKPAVKRETLRLKFDDRRTHEMVREGRWDISPDAYPFIPGDTFTKGDLQVEYRRFSAGEHIFEFKRSGVPIGTAWLLETAAEDTIRVTNIESKADTMDYSSRAIPNIVGSSIMRDLLDFVGVAFPKAKFLEGYRVSGARTGGVYSIGGGKEVKIPIRRMAVDNPNDEGNIGTAEEYRSKVVDEFKAIPHSFAYIRERILSAYTPGTDQYKAISLMLDAISPHVSDVPTYFLTAQQLNELGAQLDANGNPLGLGHYRSDADMIVLWDNIHTKYSPETVSEFMMHELAHPAFHKVISSDTLVRDAIRRVANEVRDELNALAQPEGFYAFTNPHEFVSEFWSNKSLQQFMGAIKASPELKNFLRASGIKRPIKTLLDAIKRIIAKAFGYKINDSLLDAMFDITGEMQRLMPARSDPTYRKMSDRDYAEENILIAEEKKRGRRSPWREGFFDRDFPTPELPITAGAVRDYGKNAIETVRERFTPSATPQYRLLGLKFLGMDQMAQKAKDFGTAFAKAARQVANAFERMRVRARELVVEHDAYQQMWVDYQSNHRGEETTKLGEYMLRETEARIRGDLPLDQQPHVAKELPSNAWQRSEHPKLQQMWNALHADSKAMRTATMHLTAKQQKRMALAILRNQILDTLGIDDPVLVEKLHNREELTPDEEKRMMVTSRGVNLTAAQAKELEIAIKGVRALTSYKGPYYPEMRFGNFVVTGRYKFNEPAGAKRILDEDGSESDHIFEFEGDNAKERAMAYAETQDPYTTVRSSYVDEHGNTHYVDLDDNLLKKVTKEEAVGQKYRVNVSNRYVQFFDSIKEAQNHAAEIEADTGFGLQHVGAREFDPNEDAGREFMGHDVRKLLSSLEKHPVFQEAAPDHKAALKQSLMEASLRFYGPTRVQSRRRPRRHVKGASIDFQKVMNQYIESTSGYLAKLEVQPDLDAGLTAMHAQINSNEGDGITGVKAYHARQQIFNEMEQRITNKEKVGPPSNWDILVNRVMAWTFINFLGSPSYSVNNLLQVPMIALPSLASRHGIARATRMLYAAYKQVNLLKAVKAGATGTVHAARGGKNNFFDDMLTRVPDPAHREMLRYVQINGGIAPEAGMEFDKIIGDPGAFGKATDLAQGMARAMPSAVETMNRFVLGIASYNLEMGKTGDHQAAMEYALEQINLTQGNYSRTNMPTFFHKNPLMSIAFQFKNYGQTIYGNIGHNIGKIIRDANEGDREEAARALTYLAASHVMLAGVLGLPTEPIRWLIAGTNAVGATNIQWDEVENAERELAAYLFGDYFGEVVSRGLPRMIGIDISERVGSQNLMTYGMPRDDSEESLFAYFGTMMAGASGGMALELRNGMHDMWKGDVAAGIQKFAPVKIMADSINAYRLATEGKQTGAGYQVMEPINYVEAFLVGFGYKPARHAEVSEAQQYFYAAQRRVSEQRNELQRQWGKAEGSDKFKIMNKIRKFNVGRSPDEQLTTSDLNNYAKRRKSEEVIGGIRTTRRNRELVESLEIYNR